jgi:hypothetical protein
MPNENNCFKGMFQVDKVEFSPLLIFFIDMISSLIPILSVGVPEVNIAPFEPLTIPQIKVERNEEVIALVGSFDNVQVRGASNASVSKAHLDLEKKVLKFNLDIPKLKLSAKYNLKGIYLLY